MAWGTSASHIPVLVSLAKIYTPKKILEIGSGELSTRLFINRDIFKYVEKLVSIETNPEWFEIIQAKFGVDSRLDLRTSTPSALYDYDLIFIDGPQDEFKRFKTINFVMRDILPAVIVVHDIDYKLYKKAVNKVYYDYVFKFVSPHTGVYYKDPLPLVKFKKLDKLMKKNFNEIEENVYRWNQLTE